MANARIIRKRIRSVKNTAKITRTMELVSTAKAKRCQDRIHAAQPYAQGIADLLASIRAAGARVTHPLMEARPVRRARVLLLTSNRGLCGGFNANLIRVARDTLDTFRGDGVEAGLDVIGKKGIAFFRFIGEPMGHTVTTIDDRPSWRDAADLADRYMAGFRDGALDTLRVVHMAYHASSRQAPESATLLPAGSGGAAAVEKVSPDSSRNTTDFLWDPPPEGLLGDLVPLVVRTDMLRILMEQTASEQIARRIAMKNATDNAKDMVKDLTKTYNRARQTQITQQIAEIVGGAEALE